MAPGQLSTDSSVPSQKPVWLCSPIVVYKAAESAGRLTPVVVRWTLLIVAIVPLCGCITSWNTRFPQWNYASAAQQRREAELQDPFPDESAGPDTGFRPREFTPRAEPIVAKDRAYAAFQKQQFGPPPGAPTGPGAQYPEVVPVR